MSTQSSDKGILFIGKVPEPTGNEPIWTFVLTKLGLQGDAIQDAFSELMLARGLDATG